MRPPASTRAQVLGLIDYFTGRFFFQCQEQRLTSQTDAAYLQEVLRKARKPIVLAQDGKAFFARHQDRLTVFKLPSYSPDYNPIEKLWKKVKEKGAH